TAMAGGGPRKRGRTAPSRLVRWWGQATPVWGDWGSVPPDGVRHHKFGVDPDTHRADACRARPHGTPGSGMGEEAADRVACASALGRGSRWHVQGPSPLRGRAGRAGGQVARRVRVPRRAVVRAAV